MSEVSVHRTAGGGRCLIIDGMRVAGAKPEFSGDNCVCWWETATTIGVVDDIKAENAKLRELATEAIRLMQADGPDCGLCKHYSECWTSDAMNYSPSGCVICNEARELGIEVQR